MSNFHVNVEAENQINFCNQKVACLSAAFFNCLEDMLLFMDYEDRAKLQTVIENMEKSFEGILILYRPAVQRYVRCQKGKVFLPHNGLSEKKDMNNFLSFNTPCLPEKMKL